MLKTIFAVDPGVVSGWAVMTVEAEPKIQHYGKLDFTQKSTYRTNGAIAAWEALRCLENQWGIIKDGRHMAIEGQFLSRKDQSRRNVDSLIKLARKAGRWEEAACAHGLTYEYIHPVTWISSELGKGLRNDQIIKLAKQKCEALYKVSGLSEHEYCAILIGRYVAIREYRKSLQLTIPTERSR